jgi:DNA-binding GntR family transcriptional regulator
VNALDERRALVDKLAAQLQALVLSGELPAGTRLRQQALAEQFGVSRTPVREALRQLQAMGVAQLEHNRGAVVRGPTARELREAYEVRAELEGLAAELAATRIGDEQLGRLREAQQLFRRSIETLISRRRRGSGREPRWADDSDWVRANDLFHQVIQEAAGNGQLLRTIGDLHRSFPRALTWSALSGSSALLEENIRQHNAILEAIEGRDPQEARRRMAEHIRAAGELIAHRFEQSRDGV